MELDTFFRRFVDERMIEVVAITTSHLLAYSRLPLLHRDPFDRLLLAQAKSLDVAVVTSDPRFASYDVSVVW